MAESDEKLIFISYRHDDARSQAMLLKSDLTDAFGEERVASSPHPDDYDAIVVAQQVNRASVVLVVVGKYWLSAQNEDHRRLIDLTDDSVHQEVAGALASLATVRPVMVAGAPALKPGALPDPLSDLGGREAITIAEDRWRTDSAALVGQLEEWTGWKSGPAAPTGTGVFVSYRRADSAPDTGRLYDHLVARFGEEHVFQDVDNVGIGENVGNAVSAALDKSAVLLAVIGPDWEPARLANDEDWVRYELDGALARGIPIIPVRVRGAVMPARADFPEHLADLNSLNSPEIDHAQFGRDVAPVLDAVAARIADAEPDTQTAPALASPAMSGSTPEPAATATHDDVGVAPEQTPSVAAAPMQTQKYTEMPEIAKANTMTVALGALALILLLILLWWLGSR